METEKQSQSWCEKQDLPPGHNERSVFVLLSPQEQLVLCDPTCQEFLPEGLEEPVISTQLEASSARGSAMKGKRKATFPSSHLDGLLLQVCPCPFRDTCHPTIWPHNVRIQGILDSSYCPHPRFFAQLGAIWFQPTFSASSLAITCG